MTVEVLAVDDESILEIVEAQLGPEYEVATADDGKEAWDLLTDPSGDLPDLLILDVMMPELDGFSLLERIRESGEMTELPVVLLTSRGREVDVLRAMDEGADDFIAKPFSPAELSARIGRILE